MCTGCSICVNECPVGAIELDADGFAEIDEGGGTPSSKG